jgi:hypothetical protein
MPLSTTITRGASVEAVPLSTTIADVLPDRPIPEWGGKMLRTIVRLDDGSELVVRISRRRQTRE